MTEGRKDQQSKPWENQKGEVHLLLQGTFPDTVSGNSQMSPALQSTYSSLHGIVSVGDQDTFSVHGYFVKDGYLILSEPMKSFLPEI
jgi:hypothetical protein